MSENIAETTKTIWTKCPYCRKQQSTKVPVEGYEKWKGGELIQNAMPTLSADECEALMTGICNECWDKMLED